MTAKDFILKHGEKLIPQELKVDMLNGIFPEYLFDDSELITVEFHRENS